MFLCGVICWIFVSCTVPASNLVTPSFFRTVPGSSFLSCPVVSFIIPVPDVPDAHFFFWGFLQARVLVLVLVPEVIIVPKLEEFGSALGGVFRLGIQARLG